MKSPRHFVSFIIVVLVTLSLSLAIQTSALSTWIPAIASAPGGNVSTPLNTGLNTQSKLGGLFLNTSNTQPFDIGLSVFGKTVLNGDVVIATGSPAAGKVLTALDTNGTVGWGTVTGGTGGGTTPVGTCDMSPFQQEISSVTNTTTVTRQNTSGSQLIVIASTHPGTLVNGVFSDDIKAYISSSNDFLYPNGSGFSTGSAKPSNLIAANTGAGGTNNSGVTTDGILSVTFVVPPGYYYYIVSPTGVFYQAWKVCGGSSSSAGGGFSHMQVFDASGTWTAPAGVTSVMVEVAGGGGGGLIYNDKASAGYTIHPAQNGGYGKGVYSIVPNSNYTVTIGVGGLATNPPVLAGSTSFGNLIYATGGSNAIYDPTSTTYTDGPAGTSNGTLNVAGGSNLIGAGLPGASAGMYSGTQPQSGKSGRVIVYW